MEQQRIDREVKGLFIEDLEQRAAPSVAGAALDATADNPNVPWNQITTLACGEEPFSGC